MRSLSTWLLLVSFVCCVIGPARAEDWWRFRGPNCDGISSESDWTHQWPAEGPAVQWTAEVGTGFSTIVTSDGRDEEAPHEQDGFFVVEHTPEVDARLCTLVDALTAVRWAHPTYTQLALALPEAEGGGGR